MDAVAHIADCNATKVTDGFLRDVSYETSGSDPGTSRLGQTGFIAGRTMTPIRCTNLALVLVVAGWLLAFYGAMSQMGDPPPTMPRSVIESHRHIADAVLLVGILCLLNSLWFSGRSYVRARKRFLLVAALILIPFIALFASLY